MYSKEEREAKRKISDQTNTGTKQEEAACKRRQKERKTLNNFAILRIITNVSDFENETGKSLETNLIKMMMDEHQSCSQYSVKGGERGKEGMRLQKDCNRSSCSVSACMLFSLRTKTKQLMATQWHNYSSVREERNLYL